MKNSLKGLTEGNSPLLLLIPFLGYYLCGLNDGWIPSNDSALYISLGKSIATGQGFTYMGSPYPGYRLLFPLILAPVIRLSGTDFLLMKLVVILMGVSTLGLVFLLFKHIMGTRWGLLMMLMSGMSEHHYLFSHTILSDIPYTFFSLLALWYFMKNSEKSGWRPMFVLGGILLMAFFTRQIGAILFLAVLLFKLLEIRGRSIQTIILVVTFLIPVGLWTSRPQTVSVKEQILAHRDEATDKEEKYTFIAKKILYNVGYYRERATIMLLTHRYEYNIHALRLIPALLVIGFIGCSIRQRTVIEYYFLLYILAYLQHSSWQGVRFFIPILPFLFYYFLCGIIVIITIAGKLLKLNSPVTAAFRGVIMVVVLTFMLSMHVKASWGLIGRLRNKGYYQGPTKNFLSSIQWVARNTMPENIIISDRAPWVYLLSERETHHFARVNDTAGVLRSILERNPDYIITSNITSFGKFLNRTVADYPHLVKEVYRKGDSAVHQVLAGPGRAWSH